MSQTSRHVIIILRNLIGDSKQETRAAGATHYTWYMIQRLGIYEAGIRLGATKEASNLIGWSLTKVARNRVIRATLYKICFLGLEQGRHLYTIHRVSILQRNCVAGAKNFMSRRTKGPEIRIGEEWPGDARCWS